MNNHKTALLIATFLILDIILLVSIMPFFESNQKENNMEFHINVYATITFKQNEKVIYYYSGLDPLTNLGLNLTFAKLTGSSTYNLTTYNLNTTYVSLGNYTTAMSSSTTSLTGEFIRVSGIIHAQVYNGYNITGTFSGLSGSNSSNCMGLEYGQSSIGGIDLFGYTIFSLVTGIDSSFVITAEIQVQGTTS